MKYLRLYLLLWGVPLLGGLVSLALEAQAPPTSSSPSPWKGLLGLIEGMNQAFSDTAEKAEGCIRKGELKQAEALCIKGAQQSLNYEKQLWQEFGKSGYRASRLRLYQISRINTDVLLAYAFAAFYRRIGRPGGDMELEKAKNRLAERSDLLQEAEALNGGAFDPTLTMKPPPISERQKRRR